MEVSTSTGTFKIEPGVDLSNRGLLTGDFRGARLEGANLSRTFWKGGALPLNLAGASLKEANLRGARLDYADLSGADLSGSDLTRAGLISTDLTGANLSGASLTNTDFGGANLVGADLSETVAWSNFVAADLEGANLRGTDLSQAKLVQVNLIDVLYDARTVWPDDFDLKTVQEENAEWISDIENHRRFIPTRPWGHDRRPRKKKAAADKAWYAEREKLVARERADRYARLGIARNTNSDAAVGSAAD